MRTAALLALLVACTGGGDDGGTVVPAGVYTGTGTFTGSQVINGAKSTFSTAPTITSIVAANGSYLILSSKFAVISQIDVGTGSANGTFTAANNNEYGLSPDFGSNNILPLAADQNGALDASFTTGKSLDATITYSGLSGDVLTTMTTFVANSTAAPLALPVMIAGTFYTGGGSGQSPGVTAMSTLAITGTSFTGPVVCPRRATMPPPQPTPCTVTGTLTPRSDIAAYDVSLSFADGNGMSFPLGWTGITATGLAYFDGTKLVFGATSNQYAFAFSN